MSAQPVLDDLGTDELHALMAQAVGELPEEHPVLVLWERLDGILTAGGPECLPVPWGEYSEPEHTACDTEVRYLAAEVSRLYSAVTDGVGAAIRSVRQRGYEVALPLELLVFLTGNAETAAVGDPEVLPRDGFEVVNSVLNGNCQAAEGLRCMKCGAITTQAGHDGRGWTLSRLDLMADRHRCLSRVGDADDYTGSTLDQIQDCTCVEFRDEDRRRLADSRAVGPFTRPARAQAPGAAPSTRTRPVRTDPQPSIRTT
ncbi:hypothetical protein [Streptomyces acidiscabies]|uniref:Uncharacterized protein n=1 Tax=Streptomyces acidiscabies TaxID=42234 RepID=A0ABU4LWF5_9ACTN|nr:hypothetical protein [Streptomyces acidiscabies]MDX3020050.1 hypothetical protein [Streptomyces acidiscabies]